MEKLSEGKIGYKEWAEKEWKAELEKIKKDIIPKYFELKNLLEEEGVIRKDNDGLEGKWAMITLRPEPGVCKIHTFINDCSKFFGKALFLEKSYVFEQTGKTIEEAGQGFHCHGIVKCKNYVNVKDITTAYTFIPYNCILQIGSKTGKKFLHSQKDLEFARNYINGNKFNDEKMKAVEIDKIWRADLKLKDIYE